MISSDYFSSLFSNPLQGMRRLNPKPACMFFDCQPSSGHFLSLERSASSSRSGCESGDIPLNSQAPPEDFHLASTRMTLNSCKDESQNQNLNRQNLDLFLVAATNSSASV